MGKSIGKKRLIIAYLKDTNQWYCHQCKIGEEDAPMEFHSTSMGIAITTVCQTRWCSAAIVMEWSSQLQR